MPANSIPNAISSMTKISLTKKHEPVDVVDLVGPEGGEDEIHLDEDTAKG